MRIIDADRLKEVFRRNTGHDYSELIDIQPTVDVLGKIRAEIDVARFIDKDTKLCKNANASGLEAAMQIIDKYR